MTYQIGQCVPLDYARTITGTACDPVWHCLVIRSGTERSSRERFRALGVHSFYPSQGIVRHLRGRKIETERPIVTGQLYAKFRAAPQWDVMKEQRRMILGVYAIQGRPIIIPPDIIRHLQGLTVEAERLAEARADMLRVRAGDRATINAGPLKGFMVEVDSITGGDAWFRFLTGGKGNAALQNLDRDTSGLQSVEIDI
jgi:hypothetical protein